MSEKAIDAAFQQAWVNHYKGKVRVNRIGSKHTFFVLGYYAGQAAQKLVAAELLPCPFHLGGCEGAVMEEYVSLKGFFSKMQYTVKYACGARGPIADTKDEAIKLANGD